MKYIIIYYDGNDTRATKVDLSLWPPELHPHLLEDYTKELSLPPGSVINVIISDLSDEEHYVCVAIPSSLEDYSSSMNEAYELGHILYTTSDDDKPEVILDFNGEVVLALCRRCNKGEAELKGADCIPCPAP